MELSLSLPGNQVSRLGYCWAGVSVTRIPDPGHTQIQCIKVNYIGPWLIHCNTYIIFCLSKGGLRNMDKAKDPGMINAEFPNYLSAWSNKIYSSSN